MVDHIAYVCLPLRHRICRLLVRGPPRLSRDSCPVFDPEAIVQAGLRLRYTVHRHRPWILDTETIRTLWRQWSSVLIPGLTTIYSSATLRSCQAVHSAPLPSINMRNSFCSCSIAAAICLLATVSSSRAAPLSSYLYPQSGSLHSETREPCASLVDGFSRYPVLIQRDVDEGDVARYVIPPL